MGIDTWHCLMMDGGVIKVDGWMGQCTMGEIKNMLNDCVVRCLE